MTYEAFLREQQPVLYRYYLLHQVFPDKVKVLAPSTAESSRLLDALLPYLRSPAINRQDRTRTRLAVCNTGSAKRLRFTAVCSYI